MKIVFCIVAMTFVWSIVAMEDPGAEARRRQEESDRRDFDWIYRRTLRAAISNGQGFDRCCCRNKSLYDGMDSCFWFSMGLVFTTVIFSLQLSGVLPWDRTWTALEALAIFGAIYGFKGMVRACCLKDYIRGQANYAAWRVGVLTIARRLRDMDDGEIARALTQLEQDALPDQLRDADGELEEGHEGVLRERLFEQYRALVGRAQRDPVLMGQMRALINESGDDESDDDASETTAEEENDERSARERFVEWRKRLAESARVFLAGVCSPG